MAIHHLSLPVLLTWALLTRPFLMGEASKPAGSCKPQIRQRVASLTPDTGQVTWVPIMIILGFFLGGCCALVWCLIFMNHEVSRRGRQERLHQLHKNEEAPKELNNITVVKRDLFVETLRSNAVQAEPPAQAEPPTQSISNSELPTQGSPSNSVQSLENCPSQAEPEELSTYDNFLVQMERFLGQMMRLVESQKNRRKIPPSKTEITDLVSQQNSATKPPKKQSQNVERNESRARSKSRANSRGRNK